MLPILETLAREGVVFRLRVVADFEVESDSFEVENRSWSAAIEAQSLLSADIGLAPLPDNAYTRGKCALKVLQYMAAALPVAASAVGVNRLLVTAGGGGLSAANEQDWLRILKLLLADRGLRISLGQAGRKYFIANYSKAVVFEKMLATLP